MRAEPLMLALHGVGIVLTLVTALVWPRAGQPAVLMSIGGGDRASVLRWTAHEQAQLITFDSSSGRVVARIADHRSLMSAIAAGIIRVATRAPGCNLRETR